MVNNNKIFQGNKDPKQTYKTWKNNNEKRYFQKNKK